MVENPYKVLEIDKNASQDDIKKAYRKLSKQHHPDKGGDEEKFKQISSAYDILSNPEKKSNYDRFGDINNKRNNPFNGFSAHHYHRTVRKGSDLNLMVKLTLEEIFNGVKKTYKYNRDASCGECNGYGGTDIITCSTCNGNGVIIQIVETPFGHMQAGMTCNVCNGSGEQTKTSCNKCNGNGTTKIEDTVEVEIPSGVKEGMTFAMVGKGNAIKGGEAGNLYIKISEQLHNKFIRNGDDLRYNLKLTYPQLVLGDKVDVDTIDGGKIRVTIPEYSKVNANLKVQNKGLKKFQNENNRGDLVIILEIDIPTTLSDEERELIEKMKNLK